MRKLVNIKIPTIKVSRPKIPNLSRLFTYFFVFFLFLIVGFVNGVPFIFGDGYGYYHVAESITTKAAYPPASPPEYFPYTGHAVTEFNGKYVTTYTIGQTILWAPFLGLSKLTETLISPQASIYNDYYKAFNGHSIYDGIVILTAAITFSFFSLILIYKFLVDLGFSKGQSMMATVLVYLASYAIAYVYQFPAYSHVYEIFAVSGLLFCLTRFTLPAYEIKNNSEERQAGKKFSYRFMVYAGIFAGLLVLIRPVDLLIVLPVLIYNLRFRNKKANISFILAAIPFALIFLAYNWLSYGSPIANSYSVIGGGNFSLNNFNLIKLLFSDVRGWFIWSPLMLVAIVSLVHYARKSLQSILIYILPIVLIIIAYTFWPNWWGGDSVGQRFFLVLIPFCALGIAHLLKVTHNSEILRNRLIHVVLIFLTCYSFTTLVLYRITPVSKLYTESTYTNYPEVKLEERYTAFDVYLYHIGLISKFNDMADYKDKLLQSLSGGRSLLLLVLGQTDPLVKLEKINDTSFKLNLIPDNINEDIKDNLDVIVDYKDKRYKFVLINLGFKTYSVVNFSCNDAGCTNDLKVEPIINAYSQDRVFIKLGEGLMVSVVSQGQVKVVDYKLK